MGDLNIDIQKKGADTNHYLSDLYDTFSLANLISSSTCLKSLSETSIDVFLINRTRSLHNAAIELEIGITKIETKNTVKLLGIIIDNKLNFEEHISELCKKHPCN